MRNKFATVFAFAILFFGAASYSEPMDNPYQAPVAVVGHELNEERLERLFTTYRGYRFSGKLLAAYRVGPYSWERGSRFQRGPG